MTTARHSQGGSPRRFRLIRKPVRAIWLESDRLSECFEYMGESGIERVAVAPNMGYGLKDLHPLLDKSFIKGIIVLNGAGIDVSAAAHMQQIRYLQLDKARVWPAFVKMSNLEELRLFLGSRLPPSELPGSLRVVALASYSGILSRLEWNGSLTRLERVEITNSRIQSLGSMGHLSALREVLLTSVRGLTSIIPLLQLNRLERLEIDSCADISDIESLGAVQTLRHLVVNYCGQISSLEFIAGLPNLESFRFIGTTVRSGDLSPLLKLKRVEFDPDPSYSHTLAEIRAIAEASGR